MPHKRIAVIGKPGNIADSYEKSSVELFKETGLNTGNLAFWYAMSRHIEGDKSYFGWAVDPLYLKENFDVIVFPAANQLNPDWDMSTLANLFEKSDLPLVISSIGVQAKSKEHKVTFNEGTKRFMRVISERAVKVGVRGDFTAEVMQQNGVNNTEVIGCPSNFISAAANLGEIQESNFSSLSDIESISLNLDINEHLQNLMRTCYQWGLNRRAMYVHQAPEAMVRIANGEIDLVPQGTVNRANNILCPNLSSKEFKSLVKKSFTVFFDASEWMNQLRLTDIAVGTRMHGNMLAWQAKTPCVLFPHDSRTQELAELMKLPYVMANDIAVNCSIEEMLDKVEFSGKEYDLRRSLLLDRYVALLRDSDIKLSKPLEELHKNLC